MKFTVFIPTYNGKAKVKQLLARLEMQSDLDFTVHVLIDGGIDDTHLLKESFPKCHFHSYENSGRAAIRNRALEICKQGVILFLDNDMLPETNLIAIHKAFHETNENSILVGNGFRNPAAARDDFSTYLVKMEGVWIKSHADEFTVTKNNFAFTACNLSLPAEMFARMNGFNQDLKDGEDFEFGMRALQDGVNIRFNRNALAWHDDWPTLAQYIRRNSEYLAAKKLLVKMNPDFETQLRVAAGERSHTPTKQFFQKILGTLALNNSIFYRILPRRLKFLAIKSAIYKFTVA